MTDIMQRMRDLYNADKDWNADCGEAADEIERLRAELAECKGFVKHYEIANSATIGRADNDLTQPEADTVVESVTTNDMLPPKRMG